MTKTDWTREAVLAMFEDWAAFYTGLSFDRDSSGNYVERPTRTAWLAYQAAFAERIEADGSES